MANERVAVETPTARQRSHVRARVQVWAAMMIAKERVQEKQRRQASVPRSAHEDRRASLQPAMRRTPLPRPHPPPRQQRGHRESFQQKSKLGTVARAAPTKRYWNRRWAKAWMRRRQRKQPVRFPNIFHWNCFDRFCYLMCSEWKNTPWNWSCYPLCIAIAEAYADCDWSGHGVLWRSLRCACGSNSKLRSMIGLALVKQECVIPKSCKHVFQTYKA